MFTFTMAVMCWVAVFPRLRPLAVNVPWFPDTDNFEVGTNDFDSDEQLRSVEARRAQHATVGGWQCAACSTGEYKVSVFCPTCGGPRQPAPSAPTLGTGFGGAAAAPLIVSAAAGTGYGGAAPLATTASGTVVFGASPDNNSKHIAMTL